MNKYIATVLSVFLTGATYVSGQTLTLDECVVMAVENNYRLKNSWLDIDASSQTRKQAFTSYFPTVSAAGTAFNANKGMAYTDISVDALIPGMSIPVSMMKNGKTAGISAMQPVFAGGRIITGNKLAKIGEDVSKLQFKLTEDEIKLSTHDYFWKIASLEEKLNTIDAVTEMLERLYKDVNVSVKAGVTTRNDLLRVELQQQENESNRLHVDNGLKIYKMLLAQYIGLETFDYAISYDAGTEVISPENYYMEPAEAVNNRIENKLLENKVETARLNIKAKSGERLPSVGVGAAYLYHDLLGTSNNAGVVFASVSIPITDWWGGSHSTKRERIKQWQTENERQNTMELLNVDVWQSWNDFYEAYHQVRLAEKSIESATENLRLNNDYYHAGTVPLSDVLEAQVLFQQAKDLHTDAYCTYHVKLTQYMKSTGRM